MLPFPAKIWGLTIRETEKRTTRINKTKHSKDPKQHFGLPFIAALIEKLAVLSKHV